MWIQKNHVNSRLCQLIKWQCIEFISAFLCERENNFFQSFNLTFLYWSNLRISTHIKSVLMISSYDIEWTHLSIVNVTYEIVSGSSFRDNVVDIFFQRWMFWMSQHFYGHLHKLSIRAFINENDFFVAVKLKVSTTRIFLSILQKWTLFPLL